MSDTAPAGFLTPGEALDLLVERMYRGVAVPEAVAKLRKEGSNVGVGLWRQNAARTLAMPIKAGVVKVFAGHPASSRTLRVLPSDLPGMAYLTKVLFLVLRIGWVRGQMSSSLPVAFLRQRPQTRLFVKRDSFEKWMHAAEARHRWPCHRLGTVRPPGRPGKIPDIMRVIRSAVVHGKWHGGMSLKTLVRIVQRELKGVGPDAIARAVKALHHLTGDERYYRTIHPRAGRSAAAKKPTHLSRP
jgi:hypothetical protein